MLPPRSHHAKARDVSPVIQDQMQFDRPFSLAKLRPGQRLSGTDRSPRRIQTVHSMPEGETLTGSLTPTALVQAAKQLPEDLLGSVCGSHRPAWSGSPLPAPLCCSFFLPASKVVTRSLKLCCPVNCPKKSATNYPQHDSFRTPLSPWRRSTRWRETHPGGHNGSTDAGLTYIGPWDLLGLLALWLFGKNQRV